MYMYLRVHIFVIMHTNNKCFITPVAWIFTNVIQK